MRFISDLNLPFSGGLLTAADRNRLSCRDVSNDEVVEMAVESAIDRHPEAIEWSAGYYDDDVIGIAMWSGPTPAAYEHIADALRRKYNFDVSDPEENDKGGASVDISTDGWGKNE